MMQSSSVYDAQVSSPSSSYFSTQSPSNQAAPQRRRTRQACEPCKARKRKCDGKEPCALCVRYEYTCRYDDRPSGATESRPKKRVRISKENTGLACAHEVGMGRSVEGREGATQISKARNDSVEFVRERDEEFRVKQMHANSSLNFAIDLKSSLDQAASSVQAGQDEPQSQMPAAGAADRLASDPRNRIQSNKSRKIGEGPKAIHFAWNTGLRPLPKLPRPALRKLLTYDEAFSLTKTYFIHIHPLFGFIDRKDFETRLDFRFNGAAKDMPDEYDGVICGVAAIGSLYSEQYSNPAQEQVERELFAYAKQVLDCAAESGKPASWIQATAWVLRTIYLRSTGSSHAAWLSSCTGLHVAEAAGLHREPLNQAVECNSSQDETETSDSSDDIEIQRRIFWCAQMFSLWISTESGRAPLNLHGRNRLPPHPRTGDFTTCLFKIFQIGECLAPREVRSITELEALLERTRVLPTPHDWIFLARSAVALTVYRRLRLASSQIPKPYLDIVLSIGKDGLKAAGRLTERRLPLWHVANMTFSILCMLLAMDTQDSMVTVDLALRTLEQIASTFNTKVLRNALKIANILVQATLRRKSGDVQMLTWAARSMLPVVTSADPVPSKARDVPRENYLTELSRSGTGVTIDEVNIHPNLAIDPSLGTNHAIHANEAPGLSSQDEGGVSTANLDGFQRGSWPVEEIANVFSSPEEWNMSEFDNVDWDAFLANDLSMFETIPSLQNNAAYLPWTNENVS